MKRIGPIVLFSLSALMAAPPALTFPPPKANPPDVAGLAAIKHKTEKLGAALAALRKAEGIAPRSLLLLEYHHEAARRIVRHGEFFGKQADWTREILDDGLKLAQRLKAEKDAGIVKPGRSGVIAYRSRIDGSVQACAVSLPADAKGKRWPLHVVLHGRNGGLTEVSFLHGHKPKAAPRGQGRIVLEVYGRGNNAYRWAGEADVAEAVATVMPLVDERRIVLRGFSMGGAGTWHLGLHYPHRFCVLGPGAGFTTTHGYIRGLKELPPWQEACLHVYDAADYAENAFDVPIVAYSGADDPQKAAADNIEKAMKKLGLKMTHLVAPKTKHSIPPAFQKKLAEEYARYEKKGRPAYPAEVRFVTWTLKYPMCDWVEIHGLEKHYARARVQATKGKAGFEARTENVTRLVLVLPHEESTTPAVGVRIDGQEFAKARPHPWGGEAAVLLEKKAGKWGLITPAGLARTNAAQRLKSPGQTGPIDDAFTVPFLCVRGTGKAWNLAAQAHAAASLERFRQEWSKSFRGEIRVKDDRDVTKEDKARYSLILFGDPGSNSLIAQSLPVLPLKWTPKTIALAGKEHDAAAHVPALIHPSPFVGGRYVVINSGHTFHKRDFEGTNALLYPRLGDWVVFKVPDTEKPLAVDVIAAGLFNEGWKP